MKKVMLLLFCLLFLSIINTDFLMSNENTEATTAATEISSAATEAPLSISISAGDKSFNGELYNNAASREFLSRLPMTINMSELNGNEKYYYSNESYTANAQAVGYINAGDIMLYGDDCIVLFYDSFATPYSYTPLGHIDNPQGLAQALGSGSVSVEFSNK